MVEEHQDNEEREANIETEQSGGEEDDSFEFDTLGSPGSLKIRAAPQLPAAASAASQLRGVLAAEQGWGVAEDGGAGIVACSVAFRFPLSG